MATADAGAGGVLEYTPAHGPLASGEGVVICNMANVEVTWRVRSTCAATVTAVPAKGRLRPYERVKVTASNTGSVPGGKLQILHAVAGADDAGGSHAKIFGVTPAGGQPQPPPSRVEEEAAPYLMSSAPRRASTSATTAVSASADASRRSRTSSRSPQPHTTTTPDRTHLPAYDTPQGGRGSRSGGVGATPGSRPAGSRPVSPEPRVSAAVDHVHVAHTHAHAHASGRSRSASFSPGMPAGLGAGRGVGSTSPEPTAGKPLPSYAAGRSRAGTTTTAAAGARGRQERLRTPSPNSAAKVPGGAGVPRSRTPSPDGKLGRVGATPPSYAKLGHARGGAGRAGDARGFASPAAAGGNFAGTRGTRVPAAPASVASSDDDVEDLGGSTVDVANDASQRSSSARPACVPPLDLTRVGKGGAVPAAKVLQPPPQAPAAAPPGAAPTRVRVELAQLRRDPPPPADEVLAVRYRTRCGAVAGATPDALLASAPPSPNRHRMSPSPHSARCPGVHAWPAVTNSGSVFYVDVPARAPPGAPESSVTFELVRRRRSEAVDDEAADRALCIDLSKFVGVNAPAKRGSLRFGHYNLEVLVHGGGGGTAAAAPGAGGAHTRSRSSDAAAAAARPTKAGAAKRSLSSDSRARNAVAAPVAPLLPPAVDAASSVGEGDTAVAPPPAKLQEAQKKPAGAANGSSSGGSSEGAKGKVAVNPLLAGGVCDAKSSKVAVYLRIRPVSVEGSCARSRGDATPVGPGGPPQSPFSAQRVWDPSREAKDRASGRFSTAGGEHSPPVHDHPSAGYPQTTSTYRTPSLQGFNTSNDISPWVVAADQGMIRHASEPAVVYTFNHVIPDTSDNCATYEHLNMKHLLQNYVRGVNCTVFAYGQTASGKTHTMYGDQRLKKKDGVVPKTVTELFEMLTKRAPNTNTLLTATFFEVYNEETYDLLTLTAPSTPSSPSHHGSAVLGGGGSAAPAERVGCKSVPLREVGVGEFSPVGLREVIVTNVDDCLRVIEEGGLNRAVGTSNLNERSSRSHTVFRLSLTSRHVGPAGKVVRVVRSQMNFVDLAGSEAIVEASDAAHKKETTHINLSLTYLKKVIAELSDGSHTGHVVYRNSALTKVLKQALGGNALTTVICTISPLERHFRESRSTLMFGARARAIRNRAKVNVCYGNGGGQKSAQLKKENQALKEELQRARRALREAEKKNVALERQLQQQQQLAEPQAHAPAPAPPVFCSACSSSVATEEDAGTARSSSGGGDTDDTDTAARPPHPKPAAAARSRASSTIDAGVERASAPICMEARNPYSTGDELLPAAIQRRRTPAAHDAPAEPVPREHDVTHNDTGMITLSAPPQTHSAASSTAGGSAQGDVDHGLGAATEASDIGDSEDPGPPAPDLSAIAEKDRKIAYLIRDVADYLSYGSPVTLVPQMHTVMLYMTETSVLTCPLTDCGVPHKKQSLSTIAFEDIDRVVVGRHSTGRSLSFHEKGKSEAVIDIICKTSTDKEAWMLALSRTAKCRITWNMPLDIRGCPGIEALLEPEAELCSRIHILPSDYLHAKSQVLTAQAAYLTLYDVRSWTSLDLYRCSEVMEFFQTQHWVTRYELLKINHETVIVN